MQTFETFRSTLQREARVTDVVGLLLENNLRENAYFSVESDGRASSILLELQHQIKQEQKKSRASKKVSPRISIPTPASHSRHKPLIHQSNQRQRREQQESKRSRDTARRAERSASASQRRHLTSTTTAAVASAPQERIHHEPHQSSPDFIR